jgi:hypothetical protein
VTAPRIVKVTATICFEWKNSADCPHLTRHPQMHELRADERPNLIVLGRQVRCTDHEIYAEPKRLHKRSLRLPIRR